MERVVRHLRAQGCHGVEELQVVYSEPPGLRSLMWSADVRAAARARLILHMSLLVHREVVEPLGRRPKFRFWASLVDGARVHARLRKSTGSECPPAALLLLCTCPGWCAFASGRRASVLASALCRVTVGPIAAAGAMKARWLQTEGRLQRILLRRTIPLKMWTGLGGVRVLVGICSA